MKNVTPTLRGLALAALLALGSHASAADTKASEYYEDALQRFNKQDVSGAIVQLKNALRADRKLLPAHVLLGRALLSNGQAPAAEAAFEEALRLGVNRSELVIPWAQALMAQGKLAELTDDQKFPVTGLSPGLQAQLLLLKAGALGDLGEGRTALRQVEAARALDPSSAASWLAEVPLRIRARQLKEAQAAIDKAKAIDPKSPSVFHQQGSLLHVQGDAKGALAAYDQALQLQPRFNDVRVARLGLLIDLQRFDEAAKESATLIEQAPSDPRSWYLSAQLSDRDGKVQQTRQSLKKITELLDPVPIGYVRYRPQMLMLNGQAHYGLGEREKAKPYLEAFARIVPGSPVAKLLGNLLLSEGNADRAAEVLEQYLGTAAGDTQAMALLASAYMAKGRNNRAAELMQRALQKHDEPELYTAYGLSLLGAGQAKNALKQLEIAYKKDPKQVQSATALVGLYLREGQVSKALPIVQTLVKSAPGNPSFQNLLGMTQASKPDLPAARAAFEQARKLDPTLLVATVNLARVEASAQNTDRAQQLLGEVLKADETNTEAMLELGRLAERLKKPEQAQRWLQKGYDVAGIKDLRVSLAYVEYLLRTGRKADAFKAAQGLANAAPDSLPVAMALVRTQIANDDLAGAKSTLGNANRLAPIEAPVQLEIALLQLRVGNVAGAGYAAGKALEANPNDLRAMAILADVNVQQGDLPKAEALAQSIQKAAPRLAVGYSLMGDVAMARKQAVPALEHYRRAHQTEPSANTVRALLAAQAAVDTRPAVTLATQWLKQNPTDAGTRRMLAELLIKTGKLAEAKGQYEALRQQLPNDPATLNDLANVLAALRDPQALPVAEQALTLSPTDANIMDTAGWVAFQLGKTDRALQLLRDARLRAPEQPVYRYHLAATLAKAGRKAEAAEELKAAVQSKTAFAERAQAEALLQTLK